LFKLKEGVNFSRRNTFRYFEDYHLGATQRLGKIGRFETGSIIKGESCPMTATVYFAKTPDGTPAADHAEAIGSVLQATGFHQQLHKLDMVAIKVHVGEKNNVTHIQPELVAEIVTSLNSLNTQPFLTDTSTLYKGERENGIKHALHADRHGYTIAKTGAPFIPVDGLSGTDETEVRVNGILHAEVKVAGQILLADALVVLSHATGHMGSGIGAAIKNVGMGLASRAGKLRQHSAITPEVDIEACEDCGKCRKWCPTEAIDAREGTSYIRQDDCIGCGECIAICRFGAIKFDWAVESADMQKRMSEYAAGVIRHFSEKAVYINVLVNMTKDCDCLNKKQEKIMPDIGILASTDIVAIDQATLDLTANSDGQNLSQRSYPKLDPAVQIVHAEKMGLGTRGYQLIEV
jgi:uncharacterized Fe-S center protein